MAFIQPDINLLAVFIAAIIGMIIGFLWYSPMLFGKLWMQLSGITNKEMSTSKKKGMAKVFILQFIGLLIMAYVLSHFVAYVGATTIPAIFQLTFWLWLGFQGTLEMGTVLWGGKPWTLFFLNSAHNLVVLAAMGLVLIQMA